MAEFSASYTIIIQRCTDVSCRTALISHFHDLMVLASTYVWSAVRAYHYKVLSSIEMGLASWGDPFDSLKQPFFCKPFSSRMQLVKHTAALPPDSLQTQLLAPPFPAVKSVTPGLGTMIAKTMSVPSVMSALCASVITKPKPVLDGSIRFHHVAKTPPLKIDYIPHQLTYRFLLSIPQPVSQPTPIIYHLNFRQAFLPCPAYQTTRPPPRFPQASSTLQCPFSPLGPPLPAI